MPEKRTMNRAKRDMRQGKSPSTAAGEFVREEMHHIREGKHGARSAKQAIAIGLSKARRAGVPMKPPAKGKTSSQTRRSAERDYETGQGRRAPRSHSAKRSRSTMKALRREPRAAASHVALSRQTTSAARRRSKSERSAAARQASRTKGRTGRRAAAQKAARTRGKRIGRGATSRRMISG